MPPTDLELLLDTRRGHSEAARALWQRHAPALLVYAASLLRRAAADAAEDAVQKAFLRILDLPEPALASIIDVPAWLVALVRNFALDHLRQTRREQLRRSRHSPPDQARPHDPALAAAIERLPARLREVIVLRHIAGLTFDQLSLALGAPRSTISSRYTAAVERLEIILSPASINPRRQPPSEVHHA